MVLFKRKPVQYCNVPEIEDENEEVWVIPQTSEVFTDYEAYLNRMDFYKQRRFICQITGHSGLTFLEALRSELAGAQEVEQAFPEALKGPVLRRVQFQTISRIDNLVDLIYDEFKKDYYPGEAVTVHVVTGERITGIVRDKTRFGNKLLGNGTLSPAFSRYFVSLDNRPTEEAVVDDEHIGRDRKIFTKQVLRSFIKKTVTREAWTGAPWLVKHDVAALYHIDTRVPPHLKHESQAAERKQKQQQKKNGPDFEGMVGVFSGSGPKLPELKPAPKSHKSKHLQGQLVKNISKPIMLNLLPQNQQYQLQQSQQQDFIQQHFQQQHFQAQPFQLNGSMHGRPPGPSYQKYPPQQPALPPPPPPPPIKYPIEDLQVALRKNISQRPPLKYFSQDTPVPVVDHPAKGNGIRMESVGPLLETWDTLNVYCEVFKLDSFTFDDFVEALQFTSEDVECELFVEIHCAVLKLLVNSEADDAKIQVQLPEMDDESEDEDSTIDVSAIPSPSPEPEKPVGRTTRSSIAKVEAEELKALARSPTPEDKITNRAAELQVGFNWVERLRKRDFKNGGWEAIMVGLLHQLSKSPRHEKGCNELLQKLAPVDEEPTPETVRMQYASLDINLRVKALQIVCMLTTETPAIRGFMEECSEQMTAFRKDKIIWQRQRKDALERIRLLNEERKILLPANTLPEPQPQAKVNEDVKMADVEETEVEGGDADQEDENMDTDDDVQLGRSLRRGNDRAAERQRRREAEQEKRDKADAAAKVPKQSKQFTKILKDIQKEQDLVKDYEKEIAVVDNDLREADCPRTRVLGKDRFWNRYYWFERNGMPYGGLPNSTTADAGYANGCIWVQGPDEIEREGYIDLKEEFQREYREKFNMAVPDRKKLEEGPTSVFNAFQWGYYDEPADLDALINWLEPRGLNELKLSKELKIYRDKIAAHMERRKEHLNPSEEKKEEPEISSKRMSTRAKQTHPNDHSAYRCLLWHNSTAMNDLRHLHSDEPRARKPPRASKKEKEREKEVVEERETRSETRNKKNGRQGTRSKF